MSNMIRIITRTDKGEVRTTFSDDPFENYNVWTSSLSVSNPYLGVRQLVVALYADSFQEAGQNHLNLCERLK